MSKVRRCVCIPNYETAQHHFDNTPHLFGGRESKHWSPNERRLFKYQGKYPADEISFSLKRTHPTLGGLPYYDVVLYDTACIRYFAPNVDGTREVWLRNTGHRTTGMWLRHHGWAAPVLRTPDTRGERVAVPLSTSGSLSDVVFGGERYEYWSAKLTFDKDSALLTERSYHLPVFSRHTTKQQLDARAVVRKKLNVVLDMVAMRRDRYLQESDISDMRGRPYSGVELPSDTRRYFQAWGGSLVDPDAPLRDDAVTHVIEVGRACFESLLSKRAYRGLSKARMFVRGGVAVTQWSFDDVSPTELQRATLARLYDMLGLAQGVGSTTLPQFLPAHEFPATYYTAPARPVDRDALVSDYLRANPQCAVVKSL